MLATAIDILLELECQGELADPRDIRLIQQTVLLIRGIFLEHSQILLLLNRHMVRMQG